MNARFWKLVGLLSVLAVSAPAHSQGENSYEACSDACVAKAHKCLDQITANLSQRRVDEIRTKCGDALDPCIFACQDAAAAAFRKSQPNPKPAGR
jgi:hypothetical protein